MNQPKIYTTGRDIKKKLKNYYPCPKSIVKKPHV